MNTKTLCVAVLLAATFQVPALAADKPEVQLSAWTGQLRLRIDGDQLLTGETVREDAWMNGLALRVRTPAGFVAEGGVAHAVHDDWLDTDGDIELHHFSASVGWQFDLQRWRFTPRIGALRSKLNSEGRLLLTDSSGRTDKVYDTVPFVDASFQRRLGEHWAIGFNLRETFEDFGHARAWGFVATVNW